MKQLKRTKLKNKSKKRISEDKLDRMYQDFFREMFKKYNIRDEYSGERAEVCHHYIEKHLSSNCRFMIENFVPVSHKTHYLIHKTGMSAIILPKILFKRGQKWYDNILNHKNKITKKNVLYKEACIVQLDELRRKEYELIENYKYYNYFTL